VLEQGPGLGPLQVCSLSNLNLNRIRRNTPSPCIPMIDTVGHLKLAFQSLKRKLILFLISCNLSHIWNEFSACSTNEPGEGVKAGAANRAATGVRGVKFESESKSSKFSVSLYSIDRHRGPLKTCKS